MNLFYFIYSEFTDGTAHNSLFMPSVVVWSCFFLPSPHSEAGNVQPEKPLVKDHLNTCLSDVPSNYDSIKRTRLNRRPKAFRSCCHPETHWPLVWSGQGIVCMFPSRFKTDLQPQCADTAKGQYDVCSPVFRPRRRRGQTQSSGCDSVQGNTSENGRTGEYRSGIGAEWTCRRGEILTPGFKLQYLNSAVFVRR